MEANNDQSLTLVPDEAGAAESTASHTHSKPASVQPYRLDWDTKTIPLVLRHGKQRYVAQVQLARPVRDQILKHDQNATTTLTQNNGRSVYRHRSIDSDARLFNAIVRASSTPLLSDRWHAEESDLTDEERAARELKPVAAADLKEPIEGGLFTAEEKGVAIAGLYAAEYVIKEEAATVLTRNARARRAITVLECIPNADNPQFVVKHVVQAPSQSQRDEIARCTEIQAETEKQKKGKGIFHIVSHLLQLEVLYDQMTGALEGAVLGEEGREFTPETAQEFFRFVSPVSKRNVVLTVHEEYQAELGE
jgi:hypothetical protein